MHKSLIWKEWREQRANLIFGCFLLMGYSLISLRTQVMSDEEIFHMIFWLGGLLLPLLNTSATMGSDREKGHLDFMLGLPASPKQIFLAKTLSAFLVVLIPLLGAMLISLVLAAGRGWSASEIIAWYLLLIWIAAVYQVWIMAFGAGQPTETRIAVVGLAILVFWFFAMMGYTPLRHIHPIKVLDRAHPINSREIPGGIIMLHIMLLLPLWYWAFARFSRINRRI